MLGGGGNTKNIPQYTGLKVQTSALDLPIPIGWGRNRGTFNLIWWNDFQKHAHSAKGKGGGKAQQYTYSVAALIALCWGQVSSIPTVYINQSTTTLALLGWTLFHGTAGQTPFGYITTNHPSQALSYPNIAYLANSKVDLQSSPTLPAMAFEQIMNLSGTMPGTDDVNLGDVVPDFLTNPLYGMGLISGNVDATSLAFYKTYVQAEGLFMSPILEKQEKATDVLDRWAQLSNSWIFWSGNTIKFVPLGTQAITANGVTYTPITTIQYRLGISDFLDLPPITVDRKDPADAYNKTRVEIKDRALQYNSNPIEYKDQTLIDKLGIKDTTITADEITDATIGLKITTLIGKRFAYLRNEYSFRTNYRFFALEPGDLVELTDPTIPAITNLPVRIKTVDSDEDGIMTFTAEDYVGVVGNFNSHNQQTGTVIVFDKFVAPGDVNPPAIFEPQSSLASPAELWVAASGGSDWGGAEVWISVDNITYVNIGEVQSPAAQGVLTANLPSHADPDSVNTLSVDLTSSDIQLGSSVTHADADAKRTLSLVVAEPIAQVIQSGELLSYGNVTSTGTFTDDLKYLRRGLYGTSPASHTTGDQFTALDLTGTTGALLRYILPAQYIGVLLYVKFLSFNLYGLEKQSLSDVTAYQYTTIGTGFGGGAGGVPLTPTGLAASAGASQNTVTWNSNASTDNVTSYKLYRANGTGASFGAASVIWQGFANAYPDTAITSGSGYTYFLSAINAVGEGGHTAGVNATSSTFTRPLRISSGTPGQKPNDGQILFNIDMKTGDVLPANLAGCLLAIDTNNGGVAPTSSWTITIKKNNSTLSTGTIAPSGVTGTFSACAQSSYADGDFLSAVCISPQDATAQGITLTLIGTRTQ